MKRFAYPLAILAVVACHAPAGAEIQMATSEMNNADAASEQSAEDLRAVKSRVEANMAEKKQLRALQGRQEALAGAQQSQFQIQTQTSDLQNAENVR